MKYLVLILSIIVFIKTISYGIYEIKKIATYHGGISVIIIAIFSCFYPNIIIYFNGTSY